MLFRSPSLPPFPPSSYLLMISGQIIADSHGEQLFFIGSPRIESLADLKMHNIYLSDIPLYDVTRELVLLNQQRIAEIEVRYLAPNIYLELSSIGCMNVIDLSQQKAG